MFENLHKISLISIEKAPVTQPNIYSLDIHYIQKSVQKYRILGPEGKYYLEGAYIVFASTYTSYITHEPSFLKL